MHRIVYNKNTIADENNSQVYLFIYIYILNVDIN